ncbi:Neural-cadherin, partial [Armadillidium vulgare]
MFGNMKGNRRGEIRTRSIYGEIIRLSSPLGLDNLSLFLTEGHLCFNLKRSEKVDDSQVCLNEVHVSDGKWHSVQARRVSSTLMLELDDGDGSYHNSSLSLAGQSAFDVSPHDGCHIGGYPEYKDGKVVNVQQDFNEGKKAKVLRR